MTETEAVQLTLPEVMRETEERDPYRIFKTDHFKIKVSDDSIEKFIEKLDKVSRSGKPKYSEVEKHTERLLWVQSKMKPCIKDDIGGEHYYKSKQALFKAVFGFDL
jgi:hypothetical protein